MKAGDYRIREEGDIFIIELAAWRPVPSLFRKKQKLIWRDVNKYGRVTYRVGDEFGTWWEDGRPCKEYKTLEKAEKKVAKMEQGEIIHRC